MFLIFEVAKILMDVVVSVGPFLLLGYLFAATRGVADRFVGKLIGLTILILLVDVVLSIIINGYVTYTADIVSRLFPANHHQIGRYRTCDASL